MGQLYTVDTNDDGNDDNNDANDDDNKTWWTNSWLHRLIVMYAKWAKNSIGLAWIVVGHNRFRIHGIVQ